MFEQLEKIRNDHQQRASEPASCKLEPFPARVDLAPTVVGGTSIATVVVPKPSARCTARTQLTAHVINGIGWRNFEVANAHANGAAVAVGEHPLELQFRPLVGGTHRTEVQCSITSESGETEKRTIEIVGQAVDPRETRESTQEPVVDIEGISANHLEIMRNSTGEAKDMARALARAQIRAVNDVEKGVETYRKKATSSFGWGDLAMLALSVATAGVGGAVATALAPKLTSLLASTGTRKLIAAGTDAISDTLSANAPKLFSGVTEAVQTGVSGAVASAVQGAVRIGGGDESVPDGDMDGRPSSENSYSSNDQIEFFAAQRERLDQIGERYAAVVDQQETRLQPLLRSDPETTLKAMDAIRDACDASLGVSRFHQQFATSTQWAAAVAQSKAGRRQVLGLDLRTRTATDFSKGYGVREDQRFAGGLLRIAVSARGQSLQVTSAAIDGVAQEVADEIARRPLLDAKMPIRIVVSGEEVVGIAGMLSATGTRQGADRRGFITRDELGVINVHGTLPDMGIKGPSTALNTAATICDAVLSTSLAQWGIPKPHTDDASGRS